MRKERYIGGSKGKRGIKKIRWKLGRRKRGEIEIRPRERGEGGQREVGKSMDRGIRQEASKAGTFLLVKSVHSCTKCTDLLFGIFFISTIFCISCLLLNVITQPSPTPTWKHCFGRNGIEELGCPDWNRGARHTSHLVDFSHEALMVGLFLCGQKHSLPLCLSLAPGNIVMERKGRYQYLLSINHWSRDFIYVASQKSHHSPTSRYYY